jgi:poly-beta-1,6-N-acetyl-D-glucosamine N-deacetylase
MISLVRRLSRSCAAALASLVLGLALVLPLAAPAHAADSAVVVMYHRFGEDNYPATNIGLAQLEEHLAHLKAGGYSVLPVPHIIAALRAGTPLPERTIGITIDDAYVSVYDEAWPRLTEAGFPFTLFVATDAVDAGTHGTMSWDQLRELAAAGVTLGNHGASHGHLWQGDPQSARDDIARAEQRFEQELGFKPSLFAYPYGEYDLPTRQVVNEFGFEAAFGQHSGTVHPGADFHGLPRFALNERFGGMDRFSLVVGTLPLPVTDVTPADPLISSPNPPAFGFTVTAHLNEIGALACFASHQGEARIERLGASRIEIRLDEPLPSGRSRINCTMPAGEGRWRWFGHQFIVAAP